LPVFKADITQVFCFLEEGGAGPGPGQGVDYGVAPNTGALVVFELEIGV
jgi:hypothetical protein